MLSTGDEGSSQPVRPVARAPRGDEARLTVVTIHNVEREEECRASCRFPFRLRVGNRRKHYPERVRTVKKNGFLTRRTSNNSACCFLLCFCVLFTFLSGATGVWFPRAGEGASRRPLWLVGGRSFC